MSSIVPSGPPTNFATTSIDSRTLNLSWSPPAANHRNGILRYYLVVVQSALSNETRNISSSYNSIAIIGLRPYTQYTCTISAGTIGLGPFSLVRLITTPEDGKNKT